MPIIKHNLIPECPHCKRLKKKSLDLFITRNAPERLAIRQKAMQKITNALVKRNARVVPAGMHTPEEAITIAVCGLAISMKMVPKIIKSLDELNGDTLFVRTLPTSDFGQTENDIHCEFLWLQVAAANNADIVARGYTEGAAEFGDLLVDYLKHKQETK